MSGYSSGTKHSHSRIDTMIGAGVRFEGHIRFTGVLRLEGEALGDVLCDVDPNGMMVVGKSGTVSGLIRAPHIVVGGRVSGPMESSASVEIQQGACVAGDVIYREIEIRSGGVIEGALMTRISAEDVRPPLGESGDSRAHGMSVVASSGDTRRPGWVVGGGTTLLVAVLAVIWVSRNPAPVVPSSPPEAAALRGEPSVSAAATAPSAVDGNGGLKGGPKVAGMEMNPAEPAASPVAGNAGEASAADARGAADAEKLVLVQGVNPGKPAGIVLVIAKEPVVLFRKKRQDLGEGTRIEVAQGATESVQIARTDVLRVARGRDITLFYQGRKVAPKVIDSGGWMSFVPQSSSAGADDR